MPPLRLTVPRRAHLALLTVCVAFVLLPALLVPLDLPLGWDEIVYAGRFDSYAQGLDVPFEAPRTRGVPALMAPVAAWSADVPLLRMWLSLLAGLALYVGYAPWLRVLHTRPYVVPLAAVGYGSLWFALFYAGSAMPNHYAAMGAVAAVGWFLRLAQAKGAPPAVGRGEVLRASAEQGEVQQASVGRGEVQQASVGRGEVLRASVGLAFGVGLATLMRPNDAVWIAAPLILAVLAYRPWRRAAPLLAIVVGLLAAGVPWAIEAELRFGGVRERLDLATAQQGGLRPQFNLATVIGSVDGPLLCRPCAPSGLSLPTTLWWYVLPLLVIAGVWLVVRGRGAAGVRAGRDEVSVAAVALPVIVAGAASVTYLFLLDYSAPRFLLPTYGLLALPAAIAVQTLWRTARTRGRIAAAAVALVLAGHLTVQLTLAHVHGGNQVEAREDWRRIAATLRGAGVGRGCVLDGNSMLIPVAYTAGCLPAKHHPGRPPDAWVLRNAEPPRTPRELQMIPVHGTYNKGWRIAVPQR